jgi:hypothetical protein
MRRLAAGHVLVGMVLTAGCSSEPERPECIDLPATCSSPYQTVTFDILYNDILQPTCGKLQSCHGSPQGGLVFTNIDQSYDLLVGNVGGKARVKQGGGLDNAKCSELVVRTSDVGKDWSMPPGTPLDPPSRCAIRQWVEAGALR